VHLFLRVQTLSPVVATPERRLLRVLFVWNREVSAGAAQRPWVLRVVVIVGAAGEDEAKRDAARLIQLIGGVRTLEGTIRRIGPPDRDTSAQEPLIAGEGVPRILVWCHVSEHWAVRVCVWPDGAFNSTIEPREPWSG
jgi:hypothetical protein